MARVMNKVQKRNHAKHPVVRRAAKETKDKAENGDAANSTEDDPTTADDESEDVDTETETPAEAARRERGESLHDEVRKKADAAIDLADETEIDDDDPDGPIETSEDGSPIAHRGVVFLDGKPGSGAGLKPGSRFAPASNPGAAARVPNQPLQPESLQSHGKGILHDKDLDNGAYTGGVDPAEVDAGPSGSHPDVVDKEAERTKADRATARSKQLDPDNPTRAYKGKDATASPKPIGTHHTGKNSVAGGSNSGLDD